MTDTQADVLVEVTLPEMTQAERAAVMVTLLEDEQAAAILSQLEPAELRLLGEKMCALGEISPQVIAQAIAGFVERSLMLVTALSPMTGYDRAALQRQLRQDVDFQTFFAEAPAMHPNRSRITGVVCGVRVEEVADPLLREIRRLDKLVDELAKGKAMEKILC